MLGAWLSCLHYGFNSSCLTDWEHICWQWALNLPACLFLCVLILKSAEVRGSAWLPGNWNFHKEASNGPIFLRGRGSMGQCLKTCSLWNVCQTWLTSVHSLFLLSVWIIQSTSSYTTSTKHYESRATFPQCERTAAERTGIRKVKGTGQRT